MLSMPLFPQIPISIIDFKVLYSLKFFLLIDFYNPAELILKKLGLTDLLEKELERLDQVDERLANESAGKTDGLIFEDRPDQSNLLSQRLTDILTGIKKKKDRDVCQAASLTGKRRLETETKSKRKFRKIDEEKLEVIEECDEPESASNTKISEQVGQTRNDEGLNKAELQKREPGRRKPLQSTIEKLLMFKKASFSKDSRSEEETNEGEKRCILDDSMALKGKPAYSSTPLESVSSQHCASLTLLSSTGNESTAEKPSTSISKPAASSKGYDGNKLKNLAKLGRSLSQSQKSTQSSSQFSLHEMSWDDLDDELKIN